MEQERKIEYCVDVPREGITEKMAFEQRLNDMTEQVMQISKGKPLRADGTTTAKAVRWGAMSENSKEDSDQSGMSEEMNNGRREWGGKHSSY